MKNHLKMMSSLIATMLLSYLSIAQNKDILLIHAGERATDLGAIPVSPDADNYGTLKSSDVTLDYVNEYLQGLLSLTNEYADTEVDAYSMGGANSIADIYYDPQFSNIREIATSGNYKYVIFFDSEQAYTYPEIMYEGCKQFSEDILGVGGTPMLMMHYSAYLGVDQLAEFTYRAANGIGIEVIPAAYAMDQMGIMDGRQIGQERGMQAMLSASAIFRQITGLDASALNYLPTYEHTDIIETSQFTFSNAEIAQLTTLATEVVDTHKNTTHYTGSYENDGAVVYRTIDITPEPFNNAVKYFYKGTSTHDFTSERLNIIINHTLTAASHKLGTLNFDTRDWTVNDLNNRQTAFANNADRGLFLYVGDSEPDANAQDIIDSNQANLVPLVFDWVKGFNDVGGVTGTTNALNNEDCANLWYNYHFRGWKTIPLTVGMGRLNEVFSDFIASNDALHVSDPLVYMNAAMMIASSMGTQLPVPEDLPVRRGTWTQEQLELAMQMGHDLIRELAYMSESYAHVPDSDLTITTQNLPEINESSYSFRLVATGGSGSYTWESLSTLPDGFSLSSNGTLAGTVSSNFDLANVAFKVTDSQGAIRKVGFNLINNASPTYTSETIVHITKSNAPDFALDGNYGGENGQDVYLWIANETNENQQWIEIDRGNGYYSYQKMGTNYCIDGGAPGASNGQNVYLWNCVETNQNQHWQKVEQADGSYRFIKRNDSEFAINGDGGAENRQSAILWNASHVSTNLNWFITPIEESVFNNKLDSTISTEKNIVIYPNPFTSYTTVKGAVSSTISVYDIGGKELITKEILLDNEVLNLGSLSKGIYYAQIKNENEISVIKILKK